MGKHIDKNAENKSCNKRKQKKQYIRPELLRKDKLAEVTGGTIQT